MYNASYSGFKFSPTILKYPIGIFDNISVDNEQFRYKKTTYLNSKAFKYWILRTISCVSC